MLRLIKKWLILHRIELESYYSHKENLKTDGLVSIKDLLNAIERGQRRAELGTLKGFWQSIKESRVI